MTPSLLKVGLGAHLVFSIGWLGAIVPYLALSIAGLIGRDVQTVRAAYLSLELIGWFVIVPFSLAAWLSGLVLSLGTPWGLFKHWWIVVKFLLTTVAVIVVLVHMQAVSRMARVAAETILTSTDHRALRLQLVAHAAGGLSVLLAAATVSLFKPWGLTSYGRRMEVRTVLPSRPSVDAAVVRRPIFALGTPSWLRVVGFHVVGLIVLFVVLHISGGGLRHH